MHPKLASTTPPLHHALCCASPGPSFQMVPQSRHCRGPPAKAPEMAVHKACSYSLCHCASWDLPPLRGSWPEFIQCGTACLAVCKQPPRGQCHSKVTYSPEKGKVNHNHTNQSDGRTSSGLDGENWSDCRPCPLRKATQGTTQGQYPAVTCYDISVKCLV